MRDSFILDMNLMMLSLLICANAKVAVLQGKSKCVVSHGPCSSHFVESITEERLILPVLQRCISRTVLNSLEILGWRKVNISQVQPLK